MKYSQLFGKTVRNAPADAVTVSHKLLYQAGFIRESASGRFYSLPLANRVERGIINIIKTVMDSINAQEMLTPVLHPLSLWEETNRTRTTSFELMKVKDRRGSEFALGGTAEEMMVDVVRKFNISYRDLPFCIYQFSTKFRDELRARGGLLRVREFVMKDAYSFDRGENEFRKTYQLMADAYSKIFKKFGLKTTMIESDNGYIGGEYCHEFVVDSDIGESRYFITQSGSYAAHEDVARFIREEMNSVESEKELETVKQPSWVKTMEDNVKHYGHPEWRYLKNVVYTNVTNGEIIIAVIRGDLAVSKIKLEHVVDAVGQLREAEESDLIKIGTKSGYVHSWGHPRARFIGDLSLKTVRNFIGGQKEEETDSINVNYGRDFSCEILADIALAQEGFISEGGEKLISMRGIEVGNIFQLGYHYTNLMDGATFIDKDGKEKPYYMGCYGIGIGRTLATVVEVYHDDQGIIWPESIAPYKVHLICIKDHFSETLSSEAEKLYLDLQNQGIDVLYDDREGVTAGEKFADADLIGIPFRLVISGKSLKNGGVELKKRGENKTEVMSRDKIISLLLDGRTGDL